MATTTLPEKQHAVQLVGPGQLKLNTSKDVLKPGPYQILAKVECVGLCFSDLKLLKQFDQHARKSGAVRGRFVCERGTADGPCRRSVARRNRSGPHAAGRRAVDRRRGRATAVDDERRGVESGWAAE